MRASASPSTFYPSAAAVVLALAAVYVIWGSTYLAIRFALEGGYPPLSMAGGRFVLAGMLMYAFLLWRGAKPPTRPQWRNCAFMGLLLLGFGNGLVCIAEQTVSSGLAAVAIASVPLWLGIFLAIRGVRPSGFEWIGLIVGFIGVVWLNAGTTLTATPVGLIALIIAPVAWAYGSIWSRGRDLPSPFMGAAAQMLCGGGFLLIAGLVAGERFEGLPTLKGTLSVAYLTTFGSIIGFTAYIWLLNNVRPTLAGSYAYVNPVIAVLLGAWLASERFAIGDLAAMVIVLMGVVAISFAKTRRPVVVARTATDEVR